jgi:hypothetical protein
MPVPSAADIVDKIDTYIGGSMDADAVQSYMIAGRSIERYSLDELMRLRDKYAVIAARAADGTNGVTYGKFGRIE